ncbi:MAG TPA: amidohydrolase family protein [Solirubrobacteraceae bacterium]|nr:amidohydrolase family protein [Solirubrobacteraceae bacterium]
MTIAEPELDRPIALRADAAFDGDGPALLGPTQILVLAGRIVAIGPEVDVPEEAIRLDLGDRTLAPGLIDAHVHCEMTPERLLETFFAESSVLKALYAVKPMRTLLYQGFTTVRDCASLDPGFGTLDLRLAQQRGLIEGPKMIVCPHMLSATGGHGDFAALRPGLGQEEYVCVADGVDGVQLAVRRQARAGADWIKLAASGGFAGSGNDDPEHVTYTERELRAAVETAADLGLHVAVHCYGDEAVRRSVVAGARSIEHASLASDDTLELARNTGTYILPTMHFIQDRLRALDDPERARAMPPHMRVRFERYRDRLLDRQQAIVTSGVRIALGSDAGPFPHADNWREFEALVAAGASPLQALRAGTSVAADLLELPDRGRLREGDTADIVAFDGDPLLDISVLGRVEFVMQAGRILREPVA